MHHSSMKIIITGSSGFIGSNLALKLLEQEYEILGIDIKNNLKQLQKNSRFKFYKIDILDKQKINKIFLKFEPQIVIHFAALTGVRNSFYNAKSYSKTNIKGTQIVYLAAVKSKAMKFIFSSSSSVYGDNPHIPFSEDCQLHPKSPYAKSKAEAEKILYKLYQKYKLPTLILRFFSVYGPYGREDMAPYLFTQAAFNTKPIPQFGDGLSARDYTYIDDITGALMKTVGINSNWNIINIGNSHPVKLKDLILLTQKLTGKTIRITQKPLNSYESKITYADITKAKKLLNWQPRVSFEKGMKRFINWYKINCTNLQK